MRAEEFDRDVDETLVQKTDHDAGLASHRRVHRMTSKQIAEKRVFAVRGAAAHLVARIEVTRDDRDAFGFEI